MRSGEGAVPACGFTALLAEVLEGEMMEGALGSRLHLNYTQLEYNL